MKALARMRTWQAVAAAWLFAAAMGALLTRAKPHGHGEQAEVEASLGPCPAFDLCGGDGVRLASVCAPRDMFGGVAQGEPCGADGLGGCASSGQPGGF